MSVARFIADQRTSYRVPHTRTCALLGVSEAWFYKWITRATGPSAVSGLFTTRDRRRETLDQAVAVAFRKAQGRHGSPCGSPRIVEGLAMRRPGRGPRCSRSRWGSSCLLSCVGARGCRTRSTSPGRQLARP